MHNGSEDDVARFAPPAAPEKVDPDALTVSEILPLGQPAPDMSSDVATPSAQSWEEYHDSSRDKKERQATRMRAMAQRAQLGMAYEQRLRHYRTVRGILIAFWSFFIVAFTAGMIANTVAEPSALLGPTMWFATMVGAAAAFITWHIVQAFHPGPRPTPPLPDDLPRHGSLSGSETPPWDRRPTTTRQDEPPRN
ncbi:hypothetical protein SAMN06309944_0006 [Micrococcales bacterium KH10]|nr:hypothetical protein SAMN06309944_0006 [Micrococcales bacterium KH10]